MNSWSDELWLEGQDRELKLLIIMNRISYYTMRSYIFTQRYQLLLIYALKIFEIRYFAGRCPNATQLGSRDKNRLKMEGPRTV